MTDTWVCVRTATMHADRRKDDANVGTMLHDITRSRPLPDHCFHTPQESVYQNYRVRVNPPRDAIPRFEAGWA